MNDSFECFGCFPARLERIIAKALSCTSAKIRGILGRGDFNLVLDVHLRHRNADQASKDRVAVRIPLSRQSLRRLPLEQAIAGYAATLYLSSLGLPTPVTGPVYPASIPYAPPGCGHLSAMSVVDCKTAMRWWNYACMAAKRALVTDLAAVVLQLYRHPLQAFGHMALTSPGGVPCVGQLHNGAVAVAIKQGTDVGELSPGPYGTWKEFAWSQIQGLLLLHGEHRRYGEQIKVDCCRVLEWLETFEAPDEKAYLVHPDISEHQVLIDQESGRVRAIVDWDYARTGTAQFLAASFFLPLTYMEQVHGLLEGIEEEEAKDKEFAKQLREAAAEVKGGIDELLGVYAEELRKGGAPELVEFVVDGWEENDPQVLFEKELCPMIDLKKQTARRVYAGLRNFCDRMALTAGEPGRPLLKRPWRQRPASIASSTEDDSSSSSSSSSSSPFSSSEDDSSSSSSSTSSSPSSAPAAADDLVEVTSISR